MSLVDATNLRVTCPLLQTPRQGHRAPRSAVQPYSTPRRIGRLVRDKELQREQLTLSPIAILSS